MQRLYKKYRFIINSICIYESKSFEKLGTIQKIRFIKRLHVSILCKSTSFLARTNFS